MKRYFSLALAVSIIGLAGSAMSAEVDNIWILNSNMTNEVVRSDCVSRDKVDRIAELRPSKLQFKASELLLQIERWCCCWISGQEQNPQ